MVQLLVDPLVVQCQREGVSHPPVGQPGHLAVQDDRYPDAHRNAVFTAGLPDPSAIEIGPLVAGHPIPNVVLVQHVDQSLAEGFPCDGAVAVHLVAHRVEVVPTGVDGQVPAPIAQIALVLDIAARLHLLDAIGAAGDGWFKRVGRRIPVAPIVLRQDGDVLDQRDVIVRQGGVDAKRHVAFVQRLDRLDEAEEVPCPQLVHAHLEGEHDIVGGDRHVVVPPCLGVDSEYDRPVVGNRDAVRETAVERRDLVPTPHDERVAAVQVPGWRAGLALCHRRQRVERKGMCKDQLAALGGVGIQVVEVGEVSRVLQVVEERDPVLELQFLKGDRNGGKRYAEDRQNDKIPRHRVTHPVQPVA